MPHYRNGRCKEPDDGGSEKSIFEYIERISVKSDYRVQYNTWYDRMMDIDADNTEAAFYKVESKLSSNGVPPIDGYVMDDGWNNYKADFWSINQRNSLTECWI